MSEDLLNNIYVRIAIAYLLAWIVHRLSSRLVRHFVSISEYAPAGLRLTHERQRTLHDLLSSAVSAMAFLLATFFTLGQFVDADTLLWMVGLLSAGFGFGARPLISDFLTGLSFIFEHDFDVGEKVEIQGIEGVVERIKLRTTLLRSATGEVYTIPNGEVRIVRNFSRSHFSTSNIQVKVAAADLRKALALLEALGAEATALLPQMIEPWRVINTTGMLGDQAELTLLVKTRFKMGAELRPQLLALVQERLAEAGITLVD